MARRRPFFALAALALAAVARPGAAEPVAPFLLQNLVPARTLALASFEEVGTLGTRFGKTALGKMMADPEMKAFAAPLGEDLQKMMKGEGAQGLPIPPVALKLLEHLSGLHGQAGVALVDMPEGKPVIAASLDFGDKLSEFVTFVERIHEEQGGADVPVVTEKRDGRTWFAVGDPEQPMMRGTAVGTALFLSTDTGWIEQLAKSNGATVDGSLGANEAYGRVRAKTGGSDLALSVFANVPGILARVKMPDEAHRVASALGLDAVEAAGYGMAFKGDGMLDSIVIDAPQTTHGLLKAFAMKPTSRKTFAWAPASTFLAEETAFSFSGLVAQARDIVGRIDPDMLSEMEKFLREGKEALGVDIEQELLAGLSDDMGYWLAMPETGGLYPELCVSVGVKDAAAYEKTVERVADAILAEVSKRERVMASRRVIEWHGKRLHVIDLAFVEGKKPVPFQPTICFVDGRMLVTLVPHAMKETLLRREAGGAGLAGEEDVKALMATAPDGTGSIGYLDLQAILALLYDTGVPALQTVAKPNVLGVPVRLDWAQLPAARSMRPYFRSMGTFAVCDGKSLRISIHSPIGMVLPMAMVGMAAGVLMGGRMQHEIPDYVEVQPETRGESDAQRALMADLQASSIVEAIRMYRASTGKLPMTLSALTEKGANGEAFLESLPQDPWKFGFVYTILDAAKGTFEVRSWGPDGRPNTTDDIVQPPSTDGK